MNSRNSAPPLATATVPDATQAPESGNQPANATFSLQATTEPTAVEATRFTAFCRNCGQGLDGKASFCSRCGVTQDPHLAVTGQPLESQPASDATVEPEGALWLPITALVLGIIGLAATLDVTSWDRDTTLGATLFGVVAMVMGVASIKEQMAGKRMAIAAVVMAAITLLVVAGAQIN